MFRVRQSFVNSQVSHLIQQRLWYCVLMECFCWWIIQSFQSAIWTPPLTVGEYFNIRLSHLGTLHFSVFFFVSQTFLCQMQTVFSSTWHWLLSVVLYVTTDCITVSQPPVWQVSWRIVAATPAHLFELFHLKKETMWILYSCQKLPRRSCDWSVGLRCWFSLTMTKH